MPSTISPDSLASSMARIVKSYAAEERKDAGEAVKKTARKTVQRLKKTSPKKKGGYSKGWRSKVEEGIGAGSTAVIYNAKKPGLTHLLERGTRSATAVRARNPAHRTGVPASSRGTGKGHGDMSEKSVCDALKKTGTPSTS